jgi:hypothetical protein
VTVRQLVLCALLVPTPVLHGFAKLTPQTTSAFDRYIELAEAKMKTDRQPDRFLQSLTPDLRAKLRAGDLRIEPRTALDNGKPVKVPDGMIQDWAGMIFFPGAKLAQVKAVLQDYENYKEFYKPEVTDSKQTSHQGDEYEVFLRLYKKHILTAVLNTNYHVIYGSVDPHRMYVISRSTRIAEAKGDHEAPVGNDTGFLWRLNSYWRFEEADSGVYAECEAISLSRDVPLGLGFMLRGFLEQFPKESMVNTLRGTKSAVSKTR